MEFASDFQLTQLAREPERDLLRVLDHSNAMRLLVVVLAFVPGFIALQTHTLSDHDCEWGLAALRLLAADEPSRWFGLESLSDLYSFAPLGKWLVAASIAEAGDLFPGALLLGSYFATAAVVGLTYALGCTLAGSRFGLLAAFLMACHRSTLLLSGTPAPLALGMATALLALWGFAAHFRHRRGTVSVPLLYGGVGLGLCLLVSGPLTLTVICTVLLASMLWSLRGGKDRKGRSSVAVKGLWSIGVLLLTGFAVGGWWVLRLASPEYYGGAFWPSWFRAGLTGPAAPFGGSLSLGGHLLTVWGFLAGPAILGGVRCVAVLREAEAERESQTAAMLLAWSAATCLLIAAVAAATDGGVPVWAGMASAVMVFFATFGLDEIARRRVSTWGAILVLFTTLFVVIASAGGWPRHHLARNLTLSAILTGILLVLVVWWYLRFCQGDEKRRRLFLTGCVLLIMLGDAIYGVASLRARPADDAELRLLQTRLSQLPQVASCYVIAEDLPPRLEYVFAETWRSEPVHVVDRWDQVPDSVVTDEASPDGPLHVVVAYGTENIPFTTTHGQRIQLRTLASSIYFRGLPLSVYAAGSAPR